MISWNFHRLAPDYAQGQVKELHSLLKDLFRNFDIEMNISKGFLEVKSKANPKQLIVKIMQKLSMIEPLDFVLTIGDESRYEEIFTFLNNKKKNLGQL